MVLLSAERYSEPSQTSGMEVFTKTINWLKPLKIFAKRSILYVSRGSELTSDLKHSHEEYIYLAKDILCCKSYL